MPESIDHIWKATERWVPSRIGATTEACPVERAGEFGFAKPRYLFAEKVCADLAAALAVPVAHVELGFSESHDTLVAVSRVEDATDMDMKAWVVTRYGKLGCALLASGTSGRFQLGRLLSESPLSTPLSKASRLLPFYAWIGADDLKLENLVLRQSRRETSILGIDFDHSAFAKILAADDEYSPFFPELALCSSDVEMRTVIDAIEQTSSAEIEAIVDAAVDAIAEGGDFSTSLITPTSNCSPGKVKAGLLHRREIVRLSIRRMETKLVQNGQTST